MVTDSLSYIYDSRGGKESIDTNIVMIGHAEVFRIFNKTETGLIPTSL